MDLLRQIMDERRAAVERARRERPVERLYEEAGRRKHHSLVEKMAEGGGPCIIAEMKKASPSAGLLRDAYRPGEIARVYQLAGACGLSVLTEPKYFLGSEQDLREARQATDLPILRKDFIGDPYQVAEAAAWGADVVLLIVAALDGEELAGLYDEALRLGLEVLVEAHTAEEIRTALGLKQALIGVNSRNLKTLQTNLSTALSLAAEIPGGRLAVAESGIRTRADVESLMRRGYRGFLVGEALMAAGDPAAALREMMVADNGGSP